MDLPTPVRIYNEAMGVKGAGGRLLSINKEHGYYEVIVELQEKQHDVLLPIHTTVLLVAEPRVETERIEITR